MKTPALILALLLAASSLSALQPPQITDTMLIEGCFFTVRCPWILWDEVKGATHYTVYRDGEFLFNTTPRFFVDDYAVPNAVHTYQVTARKDGRGSKPALESKPSEPIVIWNNQQP